MSLCRTDSFSLTVPDDWADRSMITWVAPPAPGLKVLPNLLCSKGEMQPDETLEKFVNRQLKELMAQVKTFDLVSRQSVLFGGRPAVELAFTMRPQDVTLKQKQLFFQADQQKNIANTVVLTAAADDFDSFAPVFQQILTSVRWQE